MEKRVQGGGGWKGDGGGIGTRKQKRKKWERVEIRNKLSSPPSLAYTSPISSTAHIKLPLLFHFPQPDPLNRGGKPKKCVGDRGSGAGKLVGNGGGFCGATRGRGQREGGGGLETARSAAMVHTAEMPRKVREGT